MLSKTKYAGLCVLGTDILRAMSRLWVFALRKSAGTASFAFRASSLVRLEKSGEHTMGCGVARNFRADRRLVYRLDA